MAAKAAQRVGRCTAAANVRSAQAAPAMRQDQRSAACVVSAFRSPLAPGRQYPAARRMRIAQVAPSFRACRPGMTSPSV